MSLYAIEALKDAGITEMAIIIGSIAPEKVQEFYGDGPVTRENIVASSQAISHELRVRGRLVPVTRILIHHTSRQF
jgi:NDP-sugar pyrophosphorylase family protein